MRKFLLSLFSVAAGATAMWGAEAAIDLTLQADLKAPITAYPVALAVGDLGLHFTPTSAKATINDIEIPCQLDDLDMDGRPDEIALVVDIPARKKVKINIAVNDTDSARVYPAGTHAYIKMRDEKKKYPHICSIEFPGDADTRVMYNSIYGHGAVMENPFNAIRIYMDNRQSIDLYGKNKPGLELETTGFYTTQEQLAEGYGRDILWAGKSVGAGSFRGLVDGQPATIDSVASRAQRVIADGPVRSIIEVTDRGWIHNGHRHDMIQRYTMWQGRRDVEVDVEITNIAPGEQFCAGIQKLETDNQGFLDPKSGLAGSWGINVPEKKYPEQTEGVGLGFHPNRENLAGTREDEVNYLNILVPDPEGHIVYRVIFAADRETDGFHDYASWSEFLRQWQRENDAECNITTVVK